MGQFFIVLVTNQAIFDISFFSPKIHYNECDFYVSSVVVDNDFGRSFGPGLWRHKYRVAALDMINR